MGTWGQIQRKKSDRKVIENANLGSLLQNSFGKISQKEFKLDMDEDPLLSD